MSKRYLVDFYDMFDGWCGIKEYQFDLLKDAEEFATKKMESLGEDNKRCGEHYGVIDTTLNREIYCTRKNEW